MRGVDDWCLHEHALLDPGPGAGGGHHQRRVELATPNRPAGNAVVPGVDPHTAVAGDDHAGERPGPSGGRSEAQAFEDRQRAGVHGVAAQLRTREVRPIEHQHTSPGSGEHSGGNRPRGTGAGNQYVDHPQLEASSHPLVCRAPQHDCAILRPESQAVAERRLHLCPTPEVRNEIQIAVGVGMHLIDRRRQEPVAHGQ